MNNKRAPSFGFSFANEPVAIVNPHMWWINPQPFRNLNPETLATTLVLSALQYGAVNTTHLDSTLGRTTAARICSAFGVTADQIAGRGYKWELEIRTNTIATEAGNDDERVDGADLSSDFLRAARDALLRDSEMQKAITKRISWQRAIKIAGGVALFASIPVFAGVMWKTWNYFSPTSPDFIVPAFMSGIIGAGTSMVPMFIGVGLLEPGQGMVARKSVERLRDLAGSILLNHYLGAAVEHRFLPIAVETSLHDLKRTGKFLGLSSTRHAVKAGDTWPRKFAEDHTDRSPLLSAGDRFGFVLEAESAEETLRGTIVRLRAAPQFDR